MPQRKRLTRALDVLKHYTGLDRAIFFSLLGRVWTMLSGVISVTLIARFLDIKQQGYYYTFYSLVAIQIIFELGFSFVILQLAAHERAHLVFHTNGEIEGGEVARLRLASILQKAIRWYSVTAVLMAAALLVLGFRFFAQNAGADIHWRLPWIVLVLANSIVFQIDPVISFLEGCGKVTQVGRLRMTQGFAASLLSWTAILAHHGLYAPGMVIGGQAIMAGSFLYQNRRLLMPLLALKPGANGIQWWTEVWPFQWRIGVSWACSYFILQIMNPVVFAYCGPAAAGVMGMSLNVAGSLGSLALAWMATKAAPFGSLIARRQFSSLDDLFFRALKQSTAILITAMIGVLAFLPVVFHFAPRFQNRILPLPYLTLVFITIACGHVVVSEAYYLRAHKKEPFLVFWIIIAVASAVSLVWSAKVAGIAGVVWAYFLCAGLLRGLAATYIFVKKRNEWHIQEVTLPLEPVEIT